MAEVLAPLNHHGFIPLIAVAFTSLPPCQATRAGLVDYVLNYQQASPTDGLFPKLKSEFGCEFTGICNE